MKSAIIVVWRQVLFVIFLLTCISAIAQKRTIKGKITDHDGEGIPGVTVTTKGTSNSSFSISDGSYSIQTAQVDTLAFSFIGFATKMVRTEKSNVINVELVEIEGTIEWCCTTHAQQTAHCGKDRGLLKKNFGCTSFKKKNP